MLAKKHKRSLTWKYSATSHGKDIAEDICSLVRTAVLHKKADAPVIQSSSDLADLTIRLLQNTTVFPISQSQINEHMQHLKPWELNANKSTAFKKCT